MYNERVKNEHEKEIGDIGTLYVNACGVWR